MASHQARRPAGSGNDERLEPGRGHRSAKKSNREEVSWQSGWEGLSGRMLGTPWHHRRCLCCPSVLVSSLGFPRRGAIGLFCFVLLCLEVLRRVGVIILSPLPTHRCLLHSHHLGEMWPRKLDDTSPQARVWQRRWQNSSVSPRKPSCRPFDPSATSEAHGRRRALFIIYGRASDSSEKFTLTVTVTFREMFQKRRKRLLGREQKGRDRGTP